MTGKPSQEDVEKIAGKFEDKTAEELLSYVTSKFKGRVALATSFSAEDSVLIDLLSSIDPDTVVFTLDTGRLPEETYTVWEETERRYAIKIKAYHPSGKEVEELLWEKGTNSFRKSVEDRKECCRIRKTQPLKRALNGLDAWITGLRRSQSITRKRIMKIEVDDLNEGIIKVNPLADWTKDQVWDYLKKNKVPHNRLHDKGYPSIGCEPCTRAVKPGADIRSGRWWWESPDTKECGLHGNCKIK
ncbi:MAG: phosphoadenylyl-sulfate reductase [Candidatus Altiarchaeota archaeon]